MENIVKKINFKKLVLHNPFDTNNQTKVVANIKLKSVNKSLRVENIVKKINFEDDIHVMPDDDIEKHMPDVNCWCTPKIDEENLQDLRLGKADKYVWIHNRIKYNKGILN